DKKKKLIVTDAVFSMDGDQAPLRELAAIKREYGAMLMVDEAHSGGIYGRRGEGLCHELGVQADVDVHMGTFSKAFGVYGAYVCGSRTLIRWLINKARTLIYSTALPASIVAGIAKAL
ncbi:aminotransferase class I/II-fold pyridoxal phosphate-dependent enzyme, partial [Paenibacillus sepulcri]|nr:aminotransferase class I/II-fold pyridoxal phosphate-dependent enzyme [Paenibacillus sepulcri]